MKPRFAVSIRSARAVAVLATGTIALSGCVGFSRESTSPSAAPTEAAASTVPPSPPDPSQVPDSTTGDSAVPASTTPETPNATSPTTTSPVPTTEAKPLNCDEFGGATAYRRMLAVDNDTAPTDAACADAVGAARAANDTFRKGIELTRELGVGEWQPNSSGTYSALYCEGGELSSDVINTFDAPIIVWGVAYYATGIDGDDPKVESEPFISDVIAPGATASLGLAPTTPVTEATECAFDTRVLVAPVGELTADAGLVAVDGGDAQVADDPTVWLPAVRVSERRFAADPKPDTAVALVEDVHSPDLGTVLELFAGGGPDGPPDPDSVRYAPGPVSAAATPDVTTVVCAVSDLTAGRDEGGQLVLATFSSKSDDADRNGLVLALFRRGSDARWRYAGRAITLAEQLVGGTDCANAPALPPGGSR